ncbi:MAG: sigma 54-interacting transcriptional regulator [Kiritimatiellia bacterium]|jgi:DNA-binding NtrC family response regulator|nr:sigma 54-interacting transcriptional regulator [Kiritimatiellia bacterium]MDP6848076.1 sigma 54-interacting transcriptional regulator [Kiritimatiellia bacterium]
MEKISLQTEEQEFLELVWKAAFSNPFSDNRRKLDEAISGTGDDKSDTERHRATHRRVGEFLAKLQQGGKGSIGSFSGRDKLILQGAHLFDVFHEFVDPLDALISKQVELGEAPCPVNFAKDVLDMLASRGLSDVEACRYFALFYQLRRAFYFIASSLVGQCSSMQHLRCSLWANVFTTDMNLYNRHLWNRMEDFSTLFLGETGTGKGAAATAIGRSGFIPFDTRRNCFSESFMRTFISMNLSQFSEALIESELFGHRKGAFTGAIEAHEGVLSRCSPHGAIFLDEIGDVSAPVQIKLLKVLEDRTFTPVGSHEKKRFHGRIIAASNRSIDELRTEGAFRDDFFYRLCSDVIEVPPLRQRIQEDENELKDLTNLIVQRIIGEPSPEIVKLVGDVIERDLGGDYHWPGNVRELEQCVRQILLRQAYNGDRGHDTGGLEETIEKGVQAGTIEAQDLVAAYCALLHNRHGTYEEVSRRTGLDRRTVKKYVMQAEGSPVP